MTSLYSFGPLISSPAYILSTSLICIDLIFIDKCNVVIISGVHLFLHINWNITLNTVILISVLHAEYPPSYEHLVLHYGRANVSIRNTSEMPIFFTSASVRQLINFVNEIVIAWFNYVLSKIVWCLYREYMKEVTSK